MKRSQLFKRMQRLLKAVEVADILNISKSLTYRLMKQGEIPVIHINQAVRVHPKGS